MIEELLPQLYRIQIQLPKNPLKNLNTYLIKGKDRNLLIDTGFNWQVCADEMTAALKELCVDMDITDILLTHFHLDHSGLVPFLLRDGCEAFMGKQDIVIMKKLDDMQKKDVINSYFQKHGFPEEDMLWRGEEGIDNNNRRIKEFAYMPLIDGDRIEIGDYSFECLNTPGHTPGHICLYEKAHKVFISGDLILSEISPNIGVSVDMENPLDEYLKSLNRVKKLEVDLTLPGHREIIKDSKARINELQEHHSKRLNEILTAIDKGDAMDAYSIASKLSWNVSIRTWENLPSRMKWFATSETISHLDYLAAKGLIRKVEKDGKVYFVKAEGSKKQVSIEDLI